MTRIAILQMTAGIDPEDNARLLADAVAEARSGGAEILFTPEMSGLVDRDRARSDSRIVDEAEDPVLATVRATADLADIWVAIGSLAVRAKGGKRANRAFLVDPNGQVTARYDKIHLFDVELSDDDSWRESSVYVPGDRIVVADSPVGRLGLSICYDIRFPALFERLGREQCDVIAIPAAFTVPTGKAHWETLLRARAIEASAWVVAAAQVGEHADGRRTYGHSMVIDPWGEIVLEMSGDAPGIGFAEIDPGRTAEVRRKLPSLANRRKIPN